MLSRSPNITRLLDGLISKKLVRRSRPKEDRRVVIVSITPNGLELLSHLDSAVDELFGRFPTATNEEMGTLIDMLDRIREHMAVKTTAERALDKARHDRR